MSAEQSREPFGLLDTNVLIHWRRLTADRLPLTAAISTITIAELGAGVHMASDPLVQSVRLDTLQRAESDFDPLPFDVGAARAYGRVVAAVRHAGRSPRSRVADQMIAAIAIANDLPLFTTNAPDFAGLESLLHVVPIARPS
ncbi:type II toxin-antitoxin system VapC family toxin [Gordonia sp. (in: high G+C Gram-positive bacteria)]|uniref:type II toxin-antitoxin system VapC family toxin n=1 Tax=Gordonia sp. (in: high G+C Gram-positive bacteria) TaxID=84139 RepID=UPI0039E599C1